MRGILGDGAALDERLSINDQIHQDAKHPLRLGKSQVNVILSVLATLIGPENAMDAPIIRTDQAMDEYNRGPASGLYFVLRVSTARRWAWVCQRRLSPEEGTPGSHHDLNGGLIVKHTQAGYRPPQRRGASSFQSSGRTPDD